MMVNAFASTIAHVRYEAKHLRPDEKSKKIVTRVNVKRECGSVRMKHVAQGVRP